MAYVHKSVTRLYNSTYLTMGQAKLCYLPAKRQRLVVVILKGQACRKDTLIGRNFDRHFLIQLECFAAFLPDLKQQVTFLLSLQLVIAICLSAAIGFLLNVTLIFWDLLKKFVKIHRNIVLQHNKETVQPL